MRITRLRASPRHGGSAKFFFRFFGNLPIIVIDPPRGRPFGGGGVHLFFSYGVHRERKWKPLSPSLHLTLLIRICREHDEYVVGMSNPKKVRMSEYFFLPHQQSHRY